MPLVTDVTDASTAGGRGGGIWLSPLSEPVVTSPGEFASAPASRARYRRIVLRSTPVSLWIWRWLVLRSSNVNTVLCRCGFKTFNSPSPSWLKGTKINVLLDRLPLVSGSAGDHQVGEFQVTIPGGIRPSDGALVEN